MKVSSNVTMQHRCHVVHAKVKVGVGFPREEKASIISIDNGIVFLLAINVYIGLVLSVVISLAVSDLCRCVSQCDFWCVCSTGGFYSCAKNVSM